MQWGIAAGVLAHSGEPAQVGTTVDVLEGVQTEAVELAGVHVPCAPAHELLVCARVVHVHIGAGASRRQAGTKRSPAA